MIGLSKKSQTKSKKRKKKKPISIGKLKKKIEDIMKLAVKERDCWTCQRCKKKVEGSNAHGSHVIPVSASQALRFDPINIKTLCFHCHINWWHKNPLEAIEWFKENYIGRYRYLMERKSDIKKWTRQELCELLDRLQT